MEREPQRHNDEVYDDKEETAEKHEERIMKFKTIGDKHFTEEVVMDEITMELVFRAWSRMAEGNSQSARGLHCRGDDQGSPARKSLRNYEVLPCKNHGAGRGPRLLENTDFRILEQARRGAEERHQKSQSHSARVGNFAMVRVMSRVTSGNGILKRMEKENETEGLKQAARGGN